MIRDIRLIGIGGVARSGKDTAAQYFIQKFGFTRVGFADALKEEVAKRLRKTLSVEAKRFYGHQISAGTATLDEAIHKILYDERTELTRALLQEFGSEVRRADNPAYWTIKFIQRYLNTAGARFVAPDVRFPNELSLIKTWYGLLLWVERPGVDPESTHQSETSLDRQAEWDAVITNDGSKEDLYAKLDSLVGRSEIRERLKEVMHQSG